MSEEPSVALQRIRAGDRRQLARALSLAESSRTQDRRWLDALWSCAGDAVATTFRLAVTGAPGAGKSTLIEALGIRLLDAGKRVAVLPVDPSSQRTGGSLLADETRMPRLSADSRAFVRPSATGRMLGGLAPATLESVELCELAGYDWVIVETAGVGQTEADAALLCDVVVLVLSPGAGDELQGLKRGLNEDCQALVVNKADGDGAAAAQRIANQYASASSLVRGAPVPVFVTSALDGTGIDAWCDWLQRLDRLSPSQLRAKRCDQRAAFFEKVVRQALIEHVKTDPDSRRHFERLQQAVAAGTIRSPRAVRDLLELLFPRPR